MIYTGVFEEAQRRELSHHGVKGMHWGQRNAETQMKYGSASRGQRKRMERDAVTQYKLDLIKSKKKYKAEKKQIKKTKYSDKFLNNWAWKQHEKGNAKERMLKRNMNAAYKRDVGTYGDEAKRLISKKEYSADTKAKMRSPEYYRSISKDIAKGKAKTRAGAELRYLGKSAAKAAVVLAASSAKNKTKNQKN